MRERKTPSAMVERQMFPRQTKRTETFLGVSVVDMVVVWKSVLVRKCVVRDAICLVRVLKVIDDEVDVVSY